MTIVRDDGPVLVAPQALLTATQLGLLIPEAPAAYRAEDATALDDALRRAQITTPARIAAFIGQIRLESGGLRYVREVWGPSAIQQTYERAPSAPWTRAGANRKAFMLGNDQPGDGFTFRGWGWLQITGRANTLAASRWLFNDAQLVERPALLDGRGLAALGAVWYWATHNLNGLVDAGDYRAVTTAINGAATDGAPSHYLRRAAYRDQALRVLTSA